MLIKRLLNVVLLCIVCVAFLVVSAMAAECPPADFTTWLGQFKQEATALGISQQTIASVLNNISYDPAIIARDRAQGVFQQSFEQFSSRMQAIIGARISHVIVSQTQTADVPTCLSRKDVLLGHIEPGR
jgi:membrane-bound lytic murein transglycosylase B